MADNLQLMLARALLAANPQTANPNIMRQGALMQDRNTLNGILATPWAKEFAQQYGEQPDLSRNADYDYRAAWNAGIRPTRDPYDGGRYHWPSSLPGGQMLKSATHPTAWKEHYMRLTGVNPDAAGVTEQDWFRMQQK